MQYIFAVLFSLLLSSCNEKVDFSTPAKAHIENYTELAKECDQNKKAQNESKQLSQSTQSTPTNQSAPIVQSKPAMQADAKVIPEGFTINEDDMYVGDPNSKLILIEYFSPTCPHCAYYHKSIYPEIKKKYIDTNKIAYVTREFIGNKQDLDASILARCLKDKDSFFKYTEVILQQQESWSLSSKYRELLTNIGQLGGLSPERYSECLNDNSLVEKLINNTKVAAKAPKFMGTPAFFINGEQFDGAYSVEGISKAIEKKLQQ